MIGNNVKCDFKGLEKFRADLQRLKTGRQEFMQSCAKELAARLLAKAIKRTPVGEYDKPVKFTSKGKEVSFQPRTGKKGGALRRGWTDGKSQDVATYVSSLKVNHVGDTFEIELVNPVEYASYVEYGHRKRNSGWVDGRKMLTFSVQEIEGLAPALLERKLLRKLQEAIL